MNKEQLFRLVREEQVVIFVGAGLSMYAGYPSGNQLLTKMRKLLDQNGKLEFKKSNSLKQISQYLCTVNGRDFLLNFLENLFDKKHIKKLSLHIKIKQVPHLKSIITTNYDFLFEETYGDEIQTYVDPLSISTGQNNKVELFKIHGDCNNPGRLIITEKDYLSFFSKGVENEAFWNIIKSKFISKHILFLGYSFQDENIKVIYEKIHNELGDKMKECFLVAPKQSDYQKKQLVESKITYIDSDAETFINELMQNIKENILQDMLDKIVSIDTGSKFLRLHGVSSCIDLSHSKPQFNKLGSYSKKVTGLVNFTLDTKSKRIEKFKSMIEGFNFDPVILKREDLIATKASISDIRIPWMESLETIEIGAIPTIEGKFDIAFKDGFELSGISYKFFRSSKMFQINVQIINTIYKLQIQNEKIIQNGQEGVNLKVVFQHDDWCYNVSEEIQIFSVLNRIFQGMPFNTFIGSTKREFNPPIQENTAYAEFHLQYFQKLKKIQQYYNVRFFKFDFSEINAQNIETVNHLIEIMNGEEIRSNIGNGAVQLTYDDINLYKRKNMREYLNKKNLIESTNYPVKEILHGTEINVGFAKLRAEGIEFLNTKQLLSGKKIPVQFKCRELWISYHRKK